MPRVSKSIAHIVASNKDAVSMLPAATVSWEWDAVVNRGDAGGDVDASVANRLRIADHIVRASDGGWTVTERFEEYVATQYGIELTASSAVGAEQASLPIDESPGRSSREYVAGPSSNGSVSARQVALDGGAPDRDGARRRRWRELEADREDDRDCVNARWAARMDDDQLTLVEAIPDRVTATRLKRPTGGTYPTPPVA